MTGNASNPQAYAAGDPTAERLTAGTMVRARPGFRAELRTQLMAAPVPPSAAPPASGSPSAGHGQWIAVAGAVALIGLLAAVVFTRGQGNISSRGPGAAPVAVPPVELRAVSAPTTDVAPAAGPTVALPTAPPSMDAEPAAPPRATVSAPVALPSPILTPAEPELLEPQPTARPDHDPTANPLNPTTNPPTDPPTDPPVEPPAEPTTPPTSTATEVPPGRPAPLLPSPTPETPQPRPTTTPRTSDALSDHEGALGARAATTRGAAHPWECPPSSNLS